MDVGLLCSRAKDPSTPRSGEPVTASAMPLPPPSFPASGSPRVADAASTATVPAREEHELSLRPLDRALPTPSLPHGPAQPSSPSTATAQSRQVQGLLLPLSRGEPPLAVATLLMGLARSMSFPLPSPCFSYAGLLGLAH